MRLNTLLNRINWHKKVECICWICFFFTIFCTSAYAEGNQVTIETGAVTYTDVGFAVDVTVTFEDMSLYNEQVYLSYHIMDEKGEEILFENQRIPINLEAPYVTMYVDCADLEELAGRKTAVIQFDLIDEGNAYWFSTNGNISFQAASIAFDRDLLQSPPIQISGNSEENQDEINDDTIPDIFSIIINVIAWVVIAVLIVTIAKTRYRRAEQSRAEQSRAEQSRAERV